MKRKNMTPEQIKIFEHARAWAKEHGVESIKKAIEVANKSAERMKKAQEPIPPWWFY